MSDYGNSTAWGSAPVASRVNTATIFGQVMSLVGIAIGFLAIGAYAGREMVFESARTLGFVAIGMLFAQSFVSKLRHGLLGMGWLMALALLLGISLGPVLAYYVSSEPVLVYQAAGATALVTLTMGSIGLATSKDLAKWMRPLAFVMMGLFAVSLIMLLTASGGSPLFSGIVALVSAGLLVTYFNYIKHHATEDDVIWLATGIFVAIVNIFMSLLRIFSSD